MTRCHINVVLVLRSCTYSLQVLLGSFLKHFQHHLKVHMTLVIRSLMLTKFFAWFGFNVCILGLGWCLRFEVHRMWFVPV
jgi:hypothetical protein